MVVMNLKLDSVYGFSNFEMKLCEELNDCL